MISNFVNNASCTWKHSLLILFIMRLCTTMTFNAMRDVRITDYVQDAETGRCHFQGGSEGEMYKYLISVYIIEFFLPALGGLVADKWLCELLLLRISSAVLLLAAVYFVAVEMAGLICIPWVYLFGLLPGCLANGIGVASMLAAPQKLTFGQIGSPIPGLIVYYLAASLGELIGLLPRIIRPSVNLTWAFCIPPLVQIAASILLRLDWSSYLHRVRHQASDGFLFPTKARLLRYFLLLAPLVLLVNVISFVRGGLYCQEINFYLNRTTENSTSSNCSEIFIGYNAGTISTLVMLAVCFQLGYLNSKNGHISARFYSGVFLLLLCRVALIAWNCWAAMEDDLLPPNPQMVHNVYATASALDGISNALALVAGYELMYRVAPAGSKNLVMGFLFTIWAVGTSIAGVTILSMMEIPYNQPILKPVWGKSNNLWVSYVVMVVETVFLLMYYGCVSTKIAARMLEFDDYCSEEASEYDSENDNRNLNGLDYQRYVSSANGDEVDEAPERSSNSL